ncbi:DUF11 domain-containing protein [Clostridium botulinum]|uniref:DUF7507 domain-containing protein n=1 Tax=Clostridium botulinum TaxID=1491 RepID=UPI0019673A94|nr:DUF11 domain-containing protein [Clostridium botulinum]
MSLTARFSTIDKAVLVSTGNSLVVCGSNSDININTSDMIKPNGSTTRDWATAGSTAKINILSNSTILYAELIWYSTVASYSSGAVDVRSIQDDPITFTAPNGDIIYVTPQNTDSYTASTQSVNRFRSAEVTSTIKKYLGGNYTVSNVPTSIPSTGLSDTVAGWTLVVVYRNDLFKPQRVGFQSGIVVASNNQPYQATVTGFTTESNPDYLKGSLYLVCANGEPLSGTDTISIGPSFANLTTIGNPIGSPNINPLTAPNNPYNNFFSGQINVCNPLSDSMGLIDISGTNGTKNNDAFVPTQVIGARNKWDITNVDISNTLIPNQTLLAGQLNSNGVSSIQLLGVGTQVKAIGPDITASLLFYDPDGDSEYNVEVGEKIVYAVKIKNNGDELANNVILSMNINQYCSFVPDSIYINNSLQQGANITNGINVGSIDSHGVTNVIFTVKVNSLPPLDITSGYHLMYATVNYNYQFISGVNTIVNYATTNTLPIIVESGQVNLVKSVSKTAAFVGDNLVYTTIITNTGTSIAKNLFFQDKIQNNCSFIERSVEIDDSSMVEFNPNIGFILPDLSPQESIKVVFSVKIDSLSPSTVVNNISNLTFGYMFNQQLALIEKTVFSNITSVQIEYSDIIAKRCNNNSYPKIGDTVTYTLNLTNVGNIPANNVQVLEPPVSGATFKTGSVKINNQAQAELNPFVGFNLSNPINSNQTTTVSYDMLINTIKPGDTIDNTAQVPFKYQITPEQGQISTEKDSNTVETVANFVCMSINESVDKAYATINDDLYYTAIIENNGNIDAYNTIFLSNIQTETSFIANSVFINGVEYPGYNPNIGFSVGTVCAGDSVEVKYKVKVLTRPNPNIVYNQSDLVYNYLPDPNGSQISNTIYSNRVQTIINVVSYTVTKMVNKYYAVLGENLVYTTQIVNTGTVNLTDIKFADNIPTFVTFYLGTVYIDGTNYPNYNPISGFSIDDLHPGDTTTITFAVTITESPDFGYVLNTSQLALTYIVNPNTPIITKTVYSNEVKTYVITGNLSINKITDKSYAKVGDTINYSFNVSNIGNTPLTNVDFTDIIPNGGEFISGSVSVNGVVKSSYNPNLGFIIGTLNVGQVCNISFNIIVKSIPTPNVIVNTATSSYTFTIDPNEQPETQTKISNSVTTVINKGDATLTKVVDKMYATIGETLTYTITAHNTGTVQLQNIVLNDIIQPGATFVEDSVVIDGVSKPGYNPNNSFNLNNIMSDGSSTVIFKSKVTSLPTPPQISNTASMTYKYYIDPNGVSVSDNRTSNTVTTNITTSTVANTKSVDKMYATIGDVLTYTSVISNSGNVDITNTNFTDIISSNTSFMTGSVTIDGEPYVDYNPNIGFTLGTIQPTKSVTVVFKASVSSVPDLGYVVNQSNVSYNYKLHLDKPDIIVGNALSNLVTTYINVGTVNITKAADRAYARINDVVNYTFNIVNTGNTLLKNISFKDIIQTESTFNPNSVYVNGVQKTEFDPNTGFSLDNIPVGEYATIAFSVTINSIPQPDGKLNNKGSVTYSYNVDPSATPITKTTDSNTTTVNIKDTIVTTTKSVDKSIAKLLDTLNFTVTIKNAGNVPVQHINFKDILDSNLLFTPQSVYINETQYSNYNPNNGFSLSDIQPGDTTTIKFATTIQTRPTGNIVYNNATISYDYTVGQQVITGTMTTNTTQTYVATGELTVTKSVDKMYATVNDVLGYTIVVKNTGSVNATNISLKDIIQSNASLVPQSVVVDGISEPTYDPNIGFSLTDLPLNASHTITFSAQVNSIPSTGEIDDTANVTFTYKLTPSDTPVTTTTSSNTVKTYINLGKLAVNKVVDKMYATIGDTINYTLTITNIGNTKCTNNFFRDIIQSDATFVNNSVVIDTTSEAGYDPNTGFNLPDIPGKGSVTVKFAVTVKTLPSDYILYNTGSVSYSYYIDPNGNPVSSLATSNTVATTINKGSLSVTKEVDKAYATIGDKISYTVSIINTGNVNASAINFRDVIPNGLTFVTNSVKINGVNYQGYNPYQSFSLGLLLPGDSVIVKFDATVTSLPNPSLVYNTANVVFSYYIDPTGSILVTQVNSNTVTTQINLGALNITKSVNKGYATHGDVLTYSFTLNNTGNVDLSNVIFLDNLQSDINFNSGSVIVNGKTQSDYDPTVGFNLGTISTLGSVTVSFTVTIIQNPTHQSVINFATGTFSYKIDPNGQIYTSSNTSNSVSTIIIMPSLAGTKVVDLAYATIQDTLNYSIVFKNTGNTTLTSLFFEDTLSNGAVFKPGTVKIDGVSYSNYDPTLGFNLPDLIAGNTTNINFQATVTLLPTPPQVTNYAVSNGLYKIDPAGSSYSISATTNTVTTNINLGNLTNVKSVDKMYAKVGDTLTYTSVITNTGNITASNIQFLDTLQAELTYISGTVTIGGVLYPSLDPTVGFPLSNLAPNQSVTVTFEASINALPVPPQVNNKSQAQFSYKIDPNGITLTSTAFSNLVTTQVVKGILNATKIVDKPIATVGDILTYTVTLINAGNVIDNNVFFQDTPSTGATFKSGTVTVNGQIQGSYDPTVGFNLGDIGIGQVVTVVFQATVVSVPPSNNVTNQATINFKFVVDPKEQPYSQTSYSNTVTTNIALGKLDVTKAVDKKFATIGDKLTYTVTIVNIGNINATNVLFIDPTPANSVFVPGTVTINGLAHIGYNPSAGFTLDTMTPGQIVTVVYQVQVVNMC